MAINILLMNIPRGPCFEVGRFGAVAVTLGAGA
jgi:hypothetical protein